MAAQGWNCRGPAKYRDLLLDVGTEEIAHVEMLSTMIARLLETAPEEQQDAAYNGGGVLGAIMGGTDPQQAIVEGMNTQHLIVSGLGATPSDSQGYPWNSRYIIASGNLMADFRYNVQLVAAVLRADEDSPGQVMRAVAATRSLDMIVEDTLRALDEQARTEGHTWAEIGDLLHVSRQAAFQRFGGGRRTVPEDGTIAAPLDGAAEHAVPVLQAFLDGRFEDARSAFGERMLNACSIELLADVREKVRRHAGEVQALGKPEVSVRDSFTVVDIPVALERADGIGRVVLDADRQVAGFFIRPAEAVS